MAKESRIFHMKVLTERKRTKNTSYTKHMLSTQSFLYATYCDSRKSLNFAVTTIQFRQQSHTVSLKAEPQPTKKMQSM